MSRSNCWILNLFVPGAGLVPIRREWLGLALALLYALCINIWIAGTWIAPVAIPRWLSYLALSIAILCWIAAQSLLRHLSRRHDAITSEVDALIQQANLDLKRGDNAGAQTALDAAMALDNERADVHVMNANLCDSRRLSS